MTLTAPVARKDHRCCKCGRLIPKGTRYWRQHDQSGNLPDTCEHTNCLDFRDQPKVPFGAKRDKNGSYLF